MAFAEDWTFQQELVGKDAGRPSVHGFSQIFSVSWSILERADITASLGSGQNHYQWLIDSGAMEGKCSGGLVWYGQGKIILLEMFDTGVNLFGQAGGSNWMDGPASLNGAPLRKNASMKMRFWEVGGALSQKIGSFIPYAGAFICRSVWKFETHPFHTNYFHQQNPIGAVLGCSLSRGKSISLNLEWRGWNENSATLSGEIRW